MTDAPASTPLSESLANVPLGEVVRAHVDHLLSTLASDKIEGLHPFILREVEKSLLETVLRHTGGHREKAARILGLHRNSLRLRMNALGMGAAAQADESRARS